MTATRRMPNPIWILAAAVTIALVCLVLVGCSGFTAQQQSDLKDTTTALHDAANTLHVAASQPGVDPSIGKVAGTLDHGAVVVGRIADAANQPGATPLDVLIKEGAPLLPEPYGSYAKLAIIFGSMGYGLVKRAQANRTAAAAQTGTDAIAAGISSGKIVVQPGATEIVNRAVADHPTTDALVDVIHAAGGGDIKP